MATLATPESLRPASRQITRRRGACILCRQKKVRCDGGRPCSPCARTNSLCQYQLRRSGWSDVLMDPGNDGPPTGSGGSASRWGTNLGILASHNAQRIEWATVPFGLDLDYFSELGPGLFFGHESSYDGSDEANVSGAAGNTLAANPPCDMEVPRPDPDGSDVTMDDDLCQPMTSRTSPITPSQDRVSWAASSQNGTELTASTGYTERSPASYASLHVPEYVEPDFSLITIFGLADFPDLDGQSESWRGLQQILQRLSARSSGGSDLPGHPNRSPRALSLDQAEDAPNQRSIDAFFESIPECETFLRKSDITNLWVEARQATPSSPLASTLYNIVLTVGYMALESEGKRPPETGNVSDKYSLEVIVDSYPVLYSARGDLLKLQTSLLFAVLASSCGHPQLMEILSVSFNCIRHMRLTSPGTIEKMFQSLDDQRMAKGSVAFLYCFEIRHSVSRGISPLLQPEHIDSIHLDLGNQDASDSLTHNIAVATWLRTTYTQLYGPQARHKKVSERAADIRDREQALGAWRVGLPEDMQRMLSGHLPRGRGAPMRLRDFCSYHECVLLLFGPWIKPAVLAKLQKGVDAMSESVAYSFIPLSSASLRSSALGSQGPDSARGGSGGSADAEPIYPLRRCLESAYTIISCANEILSIDRSLARRLYDLMMVSLCVVIYATEFGHPSQRKQAMVHLGICCGVFCSLHMVENALPFEDILHVMRFIQPSNRLSLSPSKSTSS